IMALSVEELKKAIIEKAKTSPKTNQNHNRTFFSIGRDVGLHNSSQRVHKLMSPFAGKTL
ncbi:MAG: hypothetical protein PHU27_12565, partial [Salinivirgaceae bacterium]|nr:hypothetical protein [Salinivirgaceae bacterium]